MKKFILFTSISLLALISCKTVSSKDTQFDVINLEANQQSNDEIKNIYNALNTTSTTLIIDEKLIKKNKIKSVFDTIQTTNYSIDVDNKRRIIRMNKKQFYQNSL